MRRRDLLVMLGGAGVGWPSAALSQRSDTKLIGVLTLNAGLDKDGKEARIFVAGLRELGYVPGQTIEIDYRNAHDDYTKLSSLAADLLRSKPDVILVLNPTIARAVKALDPDIPIVCPTLRPNMPDLFSSYARPGGSVTGIANVIDGMDQKLLEFAAELVPGTTRVGLLVNPNAAASGQTIAQISDAAHARGMAIAIEKVSTEAEIVPALDRLAKDGPQPVLVPASALMIAHQDLIAEQALSKRLPTITQFRASAEAGELLSYSVDDDVAVRRAAYFVGRILKGTKPADLPIEFPTKLYIVVNLKTAKAIGVTIPTELLATADEVIE